MGIRKLLLVSCVLGLASAAGAQEPPPPPDGEDMPPPPPPDGEPLTGVCITPVGTCEGPEATCGEGAVCIEGLCIVKGDECKGPADCGERSACYVVANPCETQDQCHDMFFCQANMCVAILAGPPPGGECPPDDPMCQMGGEPFQCMDASQCAGGECVEGQCIFRDGECTDENCMTAGGVDSDGDGKPDREGEDTVSDQEQDVRDQIQDQKDMQMQPLACTVSTGSSKLGGLGLLLALSTLIARRRRNA